MSTVAVVIPVWNRAKTLGRAIEAALNQSADEVVVINDASTDNSLAVAESYPVRTVSHAEKSDNWVQAMGPVFESLSSDYVVCMGADDVLYGDFAAAVKSAPGDLPGVAWSDYALLQEGDPPRQIDVRRYGYAETTRLSGEQFRSRVLANPGFRNECGVGAAIRRDLLLWLHSEDYWRLGPWSDSIGYTVAALREGCVYVPEVHGGFVVAQEKPSYHQEILFSTDAKAALSDATNAWLRRPGIIDHIRGVTFSP
jgi:glycosyltransferase involved in cell wall biosynthesis